MRKLIGLIGILFLISSCSTINEWRHPASFGRDLSGTYLGVADYKFGRKGPNKAATRLYLHEVEGERGNYHAVLLEYYNVIDMAPEYLAAAKLPALNKLIGYLKRITRKIFVYKVIPSEKDGTLNMYPMKVEGEKIVANMKATPRQLILNKEGNLKHPLSGAKITGPSNEKKFQQIFFPMKDDKKRNGIQYGITNTLYTKVPLKSTWRKEFLPGPYLSAYGRLDDEVLTLSNKESAHLMEFKINPKMAKKSKSRRERMFTNKKSAFMKGAYEAREAHDGMFLATPIEAEAATTKTLSKRIGLFIDIFDATESLNQDVVELVFVDPENPTDFLMYYEHPDNGEGN
ncbi:MAG: hypothetical protein VXV96_16195 [Bdellovibrionota bacterium]|nr:hypothetical protein [Bdellovibrionota bacterium]